MSVMFLVTQLVKRFDDWHFPTPKSVNPPSLNKVAK